MLLLHCCLFLCVLIGSVRGAAKPSRPYRKEVNQAYRDLLAEKSNVLLLPLEEDGSGSGMQERTCSNLHRIIEELQWIAFNCVDKIELQNCCEPKFVRLALPSAVYKLKTPSQKVDFVSCDLESNGGGWMPILRRGYKNRLRVSFKDRPYRQHEQGFGKVNREFWLGLKKVRYLTSQNGGVELRVDLKRANESYFAHYDNFSLGDSSTGYAIQVDGYREESSLPDSLSYSNGFRFLVEYNGTTRIRDPFHCTDDLSGPWWHARNETCSKVALFKDQSITRSPLATGPMWEMDGKNTTFDYVEMKIRPKTWECGYVNPYSQLELKKAFLYPKYP